MANDIKRRLETPIALKQAADACKVARQQLLQAERAINYLVALWNDDTARKVRQENMRRTKGNESTN